MFTLLTSALQYVLRVVPGDESAREFSSSVDFGVSFLEVPKNTSCSLL